MGKINDPVGPRANDLKIDTDLFKDQVDEMTGQTIGIDVARAIQPRFDVEGKDSFTTDPKIDIGADARPEKEEDLPKRREEDTGLTFQLKGNLRGYLKG
jgi:hypothetical protein